MRWLLLREHGRRRGSLQELPRRAAAQAPGFVKTLEISVSSIGNKRKRTMLHLEEIWRFMRCHSLDKCARATATDGPRYIAPRLYVICCLLFPGIYRDQGNRQQEAITIENLNYQDTRGTLDSQPSRRFALRVSERGWSFSYLRLWPGVCTVECSSTCLRTQHWTVSTYNVIGQSVLENGLFAFHAGILPCVYSMIG